MKGDTIRYIKWSLVGDGMEGANEKFTITVEEKGLTILGGNGNTMQFTAGEALMLLDILRNEEGRLKKMAQDASPLPLHINV